MSDKHLPKILIKTGKTLLTILLERCLFSKISHWDCDPVNRVRSYWDKHHIEVLLLSYWWSWFEHFSSAFTQNVPPSTQWSIASKVIEKFRGFMTSLPVGSYSLQACKPFHCSWSQISSSRPCVCSMTIPQHLHASWIKTGNWSQLLVAWVKFSSATFRAQDRGDPVIKSEKRTAPGSQTYCFLNYNILHFETVATLGIQLKQNDSSGSLLSSSCCCSNW